MSEATMNHDLPPPDAVVETILTTAKGMDAQEDRLSRLMNLMCNVSYKNWRFKVGNMGNGHYLQCVLDACNDKGENWTGRKWYVSPYMIDAEVIMTAFKAVMTAEEHETRELFKFKDAAIFGPHLSLEALVANANKVATR